MNFEEANSIGNIGEAVAINYIMKMKNAKHIFDVRKDRLFQKYDVDFLVLMVDGSVKWVEVKTDTKAHLTGNIAYEKTKKDGIIQGGLDRSVAQMLLYYVVGENKLYKVNIEGLRNYITQFTPNEIQMGDMASGYLIPIKDLVLYAIAEELKWDS